MKREFSDETLLIQAENFVAFEMKHRVGTREELFSKWARPKDFAEPDREALRLMLYGMGYRMARRAA